MTISTWRPVRNQISSITQANPGVVTTTTNHGYFDNAYVRLVFPANFGMPQVNDQVYRIQVLSPTSFSINQNTISFDAFNASLSVSQVPQVIPVAETANTLKNLEQNTLSPTLMS